MSLNRKQEPVQDRSERNYLSLLSWFKDKVVNLYDVSTRRA